MRLSYSKLTTFRQCPLRYRFLYLERLPRRPRRLFRAASRIHHALMRWLVYARGGSAHWEPVRAAYDHAWDAGREPGIRESRDYQEGLRILRAFHDANTGRPCRPVLLEHRIAVPLGPHVLTGMIDRVDATETGYEVIDYKLDRELRSQAEVEDDLQLGLYHLGLSRGEGIRPEALTLYFLRHNVERTTSLTPAREAELERWVAGIGSAIAAERRWEPCPGDHCRGCDFRASCPAHTGAPLPPPRSLSDPGEAQLRLPVDASPEPVRQLELPLV